LLKRVPVSAERSDADLYQDKHTPYTHIGYLGELIGNKGENIKNLIMVTGVVIFTML